jgi:hypothetical protein
LKKSILHFIISLIIVLVAVSDSSAQWWPQTVGTTEYEYQTNGSTGQRIVLDSLGGVHFTWMKGSGGSYPPPQRAVYFNYVDPAGNWLIPQIGQNISQFNGDGYPQISITGENHAAVAFHSLYTESVIYAEDNYSGWGIFSYFEPPNMLDFQCYWPYLALGIDDDIHIVMTEYQPGALNPKAIGYSRSTDAGETWTDLIAVDTIITISAIVVSSRVSEKTAIIYSHPIDLDSELENDIYYIESADGIDWDWSNGKINITGYGADDDSLFAYMDLDAIYDYNDILHIIWNAQWLSDEAYLPATLLLHYDSGSDAITEMSRSDSTWDSDCQLGAKNRPMCKMSMAVQEETGALFAVYTVFDPDDCSAGGYANGEIYMQFSLDNGMSWAPPQNLTNFPSPGCDPGNCDSDHWSSVADRTDDYLHITYVDDNDAGSILFQEGVLTENSILYERVSISSLAADLDTPIPESFSLFQNHPNPFNATTTIEFELFECSHARLAIYDITGALVKVLHNGHLDAGQHSVLWNAEGSASGVYYYRLSSSEGSMTRRMVLLK